MQKGVGARSKIVLMKCALVALCVLMVRVSVHSQFSGTDALSAYTAAVQISNAAQRLSAMESFLERAPASSLAGDALEVVTWDAVRIGDRARRSRWGAELLKKSPASALAQAALAQDGISTASDAGVESLRRALGSLDRIHKPEGFSDAELAELRREVWLLLDGSIGLDYVTLHQYENARPYLKLAVSLSPNDARYAYAYGVALVSGKNPDPRNGYWQLARAVNLNAGSASGPGIAQYARSRYVADGGTDADWKQFVAVTSIGTANQAAAIAEYKNISPSSPTKELSSTVPRKRAKPLPELAERSRSDDNSIPRAARQLAPTTDPVSLGILLQTKLLQGENRKAIVNALSDLVRHLRENDEAFLMAYSDQLDFEQDLTSQETLLEDALDHLRPRSGAALVDGVSFAVGHLDRIGKNKNRVLLVISDGTNTAQLPEYAPLTSQLHDVRINCIGLGADRNGSESLLQRLAEYSGGRAIFANDPQQLRNATWQMAWSIGIDFQR